jgi:peptide/nickel transport system substrate-binding protein
MIYDTLFAVDANQTVQPQMVDKYTISDDKLTYTFTLRDGLLWHDGQPVTSEDCIASIKRWGAKDVGATPEACGLNGSPTKVVKIFAPPTKTGGVRMDGREEPAAAVQAILKALQDKGVA